MRLTTKNMMTSYSIHQLSIHCLFSGSALKQLIQLQSQDISTQLHITDIT